MNKTIDANDKNYPVNLTTYGELPPSLYFKGKLLKKDQLAVAIVGTRHPTQYGADMAFHFAKELAQNGVTIVSGLALGIDTRAHEGALSAKGRTIAVLGSGIDNIYPSVNKSLAEKIIKSGAVLSEFEPDAKPLPKHFLTRNRIISALSLCVLVIQGTKRSGTLSIAAKAAQQGREVFALPGEVTTSQSFAPHYLIKNGAQIAHSPADIMEYLQTQVDTGV